MNLSGRAALVTGGASGIGAGITEALEAAGANGVIADRERAPIRVDLSRPGDAELMIAEAVDQLGGLDVLVNNAGGTRRQPIPAKDMSDAVLRLIRNDSLSGRVLILTGGEPPRFL